MGHESGRNKLAETAARHGVALSSENIVWGKSIVEVSGKNTISDHLRGFLQEVGAAVLRRRFQREEHEISSEMVGELALGYGGLEGLMVTPFSVPTSTYPAFWCPGVREVTPIPGEPSISFPWVPLFIRTVAHRGNG